ncbi:MAG: hypothetical protein LBC07_01200 [Elusimicrobiota bacterium]|nr:hypothetical protein [Elusimicrobiota bacterium]
MRKTFDYDESHEYLEVPYIRISNHYKYILSNTVFEILVIDDPLEFVDPYEEQRLIDWLVNMKVLNEGDLVRNDQEL